MLRKHQCVEGGRQIATLRSEQERKNATSAGGGQAKRTIPSEQQKVSFSSCCSVRDFKRWRTSVGGGAHGFAAIFAALPHIDGGEVTNTLVARNTFCVPSKIKRTQNMLRDKWYR